MNHDASVSAPCPPPAPRVAFALLATGVGISVASAIAGVTGHTLGGATAFVLGQLLVGLALVRVFDDAWRLQDLRLVLLLVYALYGMTAALAALAGGGEPLPGLTAATFLYGTGLVGINATLAIAPVRWLDIPRHAFDQYRVTTVNYALLIAMVVFVYAYARSRGVVFSLRVDRTQSALLNTQLWVVSMLAANGMMMYMLAGWDDMTGLGRLTTVLCVGGFVLLHVTLGNRRDYLPVTMFAVATFCTRRRAKIGARSALVIGVAFLTLLLLGVLRQVLLNPLLALENPLLLVLQSNEFAFPIQTLMFYVSAGATYRFGLTYLTWPSLFIPRVLWPGKPDSLGIQFLMDAFGTKEYQGFAYTPITEAFLNFGWLGPLLAMTAFGALASWLVRRARSRHVLYLLCYALVFDFNRGDIAGVMYSLVLIGSGFVIQRVLGDLFAPVALGQPRLRSTSRVIAHG